MNNADLLWLFNAAKEMDTIVEIGSWKGRSTHALLSGCKGTVYAVDHFLGSVAERDNAHAEAQTGDVYREFMENVGNFKNLKVLRMDNAEAVKQFEDNSVDMVFIDGGHTYEEVLDDIKRWLPKTKKIICGHDRRYWQVKRAVRAMFGEGFERNEGRNSNIWIKKIESPEKNAVNGVDLSILIPARNEEFLKRTVEDILSNIEGKTEIIVVLDGYETELPNDPRLRVIHNPESVGQRAATNQACRLSEAKYVMKCDAHCAFDKGFDVKMMAEMHDDWTMVPVMRNLHVFNWICPDGHRRYQSPSGPCAECGKPTVKEVVWIAKTNPQSTSYCFDQEPHFQYFREYKRHPDYKKSLEATGLTDTMSLQGSCFMLTREKYWELNISDEAFGSWGSQGIEVACKTWLSGGRVAVNHKTWYAHMFRTQGGDFGFPYPQSGSAVGHAKKTARELFFDNKWEKQIRPLSWLIEKFWPVPGWTEELREKIKVWPLQNQPGAKAEVVADKPAEMTRQSMFRAQVEAQSGDFAPSDGESREQNVMEPRNAASAPSAGIVYYTDNLLDEKIMKVCREQLKRAAGGRKIVSVSLKPLDFGHNIVLPLERGYLSMFRQILAGLEALDTDIAYLCEHDVMYHPSHFDFVPPRKDIFYYNGNFWFLRSDDGFALHYAVSPVAGLCANREALVTHYRERVAMVEKEGFSYNMGFEPMTHRRIKWENWYNFEIYQSAFPNVDIHHGKNLTKKRWSQDQFRRKPTDWKEADIDTIPGWSNLRGLLRNFPEG